MFRCSKSQLSIRNMLKALLTLLFMVSGDIVSLIEFASFLIWTFYGLAFVALIVLRISQPETYRPYKVCSRIEKRVIQGEIFKCLSHVYSLF